VRARNLSCRLRLTLRRPHHRFDAFPSQDVALIHHFILENVHWFYRISLRHSLFGFEIPPEEIDPLVWLAAWTFVGATFIFFFYWTLNWGLLTGPDMLPFWGLFFGCNMAQDIFFTQIVKILILKVNRPLSISI